MRLDFLDSRSNDLKYKILSIGLSKKISCYHVRELGRCVIGGLVYRGQRCSALRGKYLFGDNAAEWKTDDSKTGRVWALPVAGDRTTGAPEVVADVEDIVSIDEDAQGEVYFSMLATGRVTTLVPAP